MTNKKTNDVQPFDLILIGFAVVLYTINILFSFGIINAPHLITSLILSVAIISFSIFLLRQRSKASGYICLTCGLIILIIAFIF